MENSGSTRLESECKDGQVEASLVDVLVFHGSFSCKYCKNLFRPSQNNNKK